MCSQIGEDISDTEILIVESLSFSSAFWFKMQDRMYNWTELNSTKQNPGQIYDRSFQWSIIEFIFLTKSLYKP